MHLIVFTVPFLVFLPCVIFSLDTCTMDDMNFEYTECDSNGGHWRVYVPKVPGQCAPTTFPVAPTRGKDCSFACSAGQYLQVQGNEECHPCGAGTYSLGGAVRYDEWEKLPTGFNVKTEHMSPSLFGGALAKVAKRNCSRSGWTPRGSYIMSLPDACPTNLIFSTKLIKAGKVTFEYQYTDQDAIFHFLVQNDQCQAYADDGYERWPKMTREGKWSTVVVELKSGMNVLEWRSIGALSEMMHTTASPILIRKIEISGVAYTSECTKCANGTYSSGGSSFCQVCPANHYSGHGEQQCTACLDSEYADPGSAKCQPKPACTEYDYYRYQKPCSEEGKTQVEYQWITPKICNEEATDSIQLPVAGPEVDCPPCNPGMHKVNASHCDFCQENQFADKDGVCQDCAASTSPEYQIKYKNWVGIPPNITSQCISIGVEPCSDTAGWSPAGDHIKTTYGMQDNNIFLVLIMKVGGFRGEPGTVEGKPISLASIEFDLDIDCKSMCQLLFLSDAAGKNEVLKEWEETTVKATYSFDIHTNESVTFTWAFQPDNFGYEEVESRNFARIHRIKVSNTVTGAAAGCQTCPEGKGDDGCIPCPDGHYVDSSTQQCKACPAGSVLPSSNSWGINRCKQCGSGLHPVGGRSCKSDCRFTDDKGRTYDFTELDGNHFVSGARLFTASGTQYYHGFNFTLCNTANAPLPTCVNNVSAEAVEIGDQPLGSASKLTAMVCRSTMVPQADADKPLISTQPVSLGSHLTQVMSNVSRLHDQYQEEGFELEGVERDIHFYYESGSTTSACPNGRVTIISLRCDPQEKSKGRILLPPMCSDGTCDGCTFHFLWLTRHACATCAREDYKVVRGECLEGEQTIHYFPPDHCLQIPESQLIPNKQKCTALPFAVMVAIPVTLGLALIMCLGLVYCWTRNRKLEYKYMKLVHTAGGNDGELPAAETCGMDDEEDEDEVTFNDAQRGEGLMGRFQNSFGARRQDDENPFVAVKMSDKMPLT